MDKQIIHQLHSDFERYAHTYESSGDETSGVEYWFARDLQKLLGYAQWRNFEPLKTMMKKLTSNVPNLRYGLCVGRCGLCVGIIALLSVFSFAQAPTEADHKAGERMTITIKDVEYAFRWCPSGQFMMGSPADERNRSDGESQRQVTLSKGFWMLETEVTQAMWESVMENNPSRFKGAKLPVEQVSWNDCQEFIKKLNELTVAPAGYKFSLPTEAQWEYACRSGTTTAYHFGDTLTLRQANFFSIFGRDQTRDVGSYPANAWGLRDMHGNVWEWCLDWYGNDPGGAVTDPAGAERGSSRVLRGGSWNLHAQYCRSAFRYRNSPAGRYNSVGFRLSLVLE